MTFLSVELVEDLLEARDYREFLKRLIESSKADGKRLNLADIARRAQFSSRSFISDIMRGKRRITPNTLPRFKQAFKLKGLWAQYFELLVMTIEPDCRPIKFKEEDLPHMKSALRQKLRDKASSQRPIKKENLAQLLQSIFVFDVFAALGSAEKGADFNLVLKRTKLEAKLVLNILENLTRLGFIQKKRARYFAGVGHFDIAHLGADHSFKQAYQQALQAWLERSKRMKDDPSVWFFHTAFSLNRSQLIELNKRLKETLFEFIDQAQVDDGDTVVRLTLGFG